MHFKSHPFTRAVLDIFGRDHTTFALHVARVAASAGLLLPGRSRWRGAANVFLGMSNAALYPRHRYGTDGSDQVATLVQTTAGLARLARSPEVKDALMWYIALQSNLSYLVSGWVKLIGRSWREGSALGGVMRTRTYGHKGFWTLTQRYPTAARYLAHGVLALECLFPVAYLRGGLLARPIIGSAATFHVANGFLMGLGRFVTSFIAMHPMVAYTSAPKRAPQVAGRDDRAVLGTALAAGLAVAGLAGTAVARRARATEGWPGSRTITTRHGNRLSYDLRLRPDRRTPVVVFVNALLSTAEHFGWITEKLVEDSDHDLITYNRAGYAASDYRGGREFTLQESVDDLVDLIEGAVPEGRDVVIVGHSLGGELARRAAGVLGDRVRGIVYLDSSHPGELARSKQQDEAAKRLKGGIDMFVTSLKLGLGGLLVRPEWVNNLPASYRSRAFAQYADRRMWEAGLREWAATERDFRSFDPGCALPPVDAHALVLSAQHTVDRDPEQLLMHKELADAHRGRGKVVRTAVVEGADHDSLLTSARLATEVGEHILGFLDEIGTEDASAVAEPATAGEVR
ncbi:alpha/beta fold hydrolase [Amycolatopsis arida]|uniref:alpha/beta fold hydrolase n=1 Tax=Amycolatopsis arida TaxID=587909 RepID=UPI001AB055D8|nr:alpha/beta fold hydrolase [Amycolatopsis arida]